MSRTLSSEITSDGQFLPLSEAFYSLQGEGFHAGMPAYFVRLAGCDVGCPWCDTKESWDRDKFQQVDIEKIVADALRYPSKRVIITGGEPLIYPLGKLTLLFKKYGKDIFLETSGCSPMSGYFDWVCLSPKRAKNPLEENFKYADELKVVIGEEADFTYAEECASKVREGCLLYLQPEWSKKATIMQQIVDYIKRQPEWSLSLQIHKFIDIP